MSHFETEQWMDFLRKATSKADRSAMETHLASGCARCGRTVKVLQGVTAIAQAENQFEPPANLVRVAKALYRPQQSERLVARLVYDSFRQPLPAGVRSQDRITRQALFEAGGYSVHLRVEHHGTSEIATLMGQLGNRESPGAPADDVQVRLKTRKKIIATTSCNSFGEFHLAYSPAPALQLEVSLGWTGRVLDVPLGTVLDQSSVRKTGKLRGPSR